jgi:hypothetical protein
MAQEADAAAARSRRRTKVPGFRSRRRMSVPLIAHSKKRRALSHARALSSRPPERVSAAPRFVGNRRRQMVSKAVLSTARDIARLGYVAQARGLPLQANIAWRACVEQCPEIGAASGTSFGPFLGFAPVENHPVRQASHFAVRDNRRRMRFVLRVAVDEEFASGFDGTKGRIRRTSATIAPAIATKLAARTPLRTWPAVDARTSAKCCADESSPPRAERGWRRAGDAERLST